MSLCVNREVQLMKNFAVGTAYHTQLTLKLELGASLSVGKSRFIYLDYHCSLHNPEM